MEQGTHSNPAHGEGSLGTRSTRASKALKRAWRVLWRAALVVAALTVLVLIGLRLYLSDGRLKEISEQKLSHLLKAPVSIEALSVSLLRGVELRELRLGAPEGFGSDALEVRRLALRWSLWPLLVGTVRIEEVAIEEPSLIIEDRDGRSNLEALLAAVTSPPQEDAQEEEVENGSLSLADISLPLRVEIEELALTQARVALQLGELALAVDGIQVAGQFAGEDRALALDLWAGLGEREEGGQSSRLDLTRHDPPARVGSEQRLGVHVTTEGLAKVQTSVKLKAHIDVEEPPLGAMEAVGELDMAANLIAGTLSVERCSWRVGEGTSVNLEAEASELLGEPKVLLSRLQAGSDLGELSALLQAFSPGTTLRGQVELAASPSTLVRAADSKIPRVETTLRLRARDVGGSGFGMALRGLDVTLDLALKGTETALEAEAGLKQARLKGQEIRDVALRAKAQAELQAFLGGRDEGEATGELEVAVHHVAALAYTVEDLRLRLAGTAPMALLKHGLHPDEALAGTGEISLRRAALPQLNVAVTGLAGGFEGQSQDLKGDRVAGKVHLGVREVRGSPGGAPARMSDLALSVAAARHGQSVAIDALALRLGELARLDARVRLENYLDPVPRIDDLELKAEVLDLAALLALAPPGTLPSERLSGKAHLVVQARGTVPYSELAETFSPPQVSLDEMSVGWEGAVRSWTGYLEQVAKRFEQGLPFDAAVEVHLQELSVAMAQAEADGIDFEMNVTLKPHAARVGFELGVEQTLKPLGAEAIQAGVSLAFEDGLLDLRAHGNAGAVRHEAVVEPLSLGLRLGLRHRLGGDALLDTLVIESSSLAFRIGLSGLIGKPLRMVLERGWEKQGLPGVDAALSLAASLERGEVRPLLAGGLVLGGSVALEGRVRVAQGAGEFGGELVAENLSLVAGLTTVENFSGHLPFTQRFAFPREQTTREDQPTNLLLLHRFPAPSTLVVALETSPEDIRKRPARPAYYARLRAYRRKAGLSIEAIRQGPYDVDRLELEARIEQGMLIGDWISVHVLGGDVLGNIALQLGNDRSLKADLAVQVSNLDASHFKDLDLEPGPDSELNADLHVGALFGPGQRDLDVSMNLTRIGNETIDRVLQLLDPEGKSADIKDWRDNLSIIDINSMKAWVSAENLNVDLDYTAIFRVPWTDIGYRPLEREVLRRYALGGKLEVLVQPFFDKYVAHYLGWPQTTAVASRP